MTEPLRALPDALVLGAGGTLGIAWLRGVVAGIEDATGLDLRGCGSFVGTSAGAYVAATLAAGARGASDDGDEGIADASAELERETAEHELLDAAAADAGAGVGPGAGAGVGPGAGAGAGAGVGAGASAGVGPGAGAGVGPGAGAGVGPGAGAGAADGGAGAGAGGDAGSAGGAGAGAGDRARATAGLSRLGPGAAMAAVAGGARLAAPLLPIALAASRPPGAAVRRAALALAGQAGSTPLSFGPREAGLGAFDGRLRIVTVDRRRGTRVVFGAPGAPDATVAEAVRASCAVPWIFSPVGIGGREYVDGGVWSLSNLDVAPAGRGDHVLALLPTFRRPGVGGGGGGLGLLRAASQGVGLAEVGVLRSRGARVRIVAPDTASTAAIGANPMDPSRRAAVTAAGREQGRRFGTR